MIHCSYSPSYFHSLIHSLSLQLSLYLPFSFFLSRNFFLFFFILFHPPSFLLNCHKLKEISHPSIPIPSPILIPSSCSSPIITLQKRKTMLRQSHNRGHIALSLLQKMMPSMILWYDIILKFRNWKINLKRKSVCSDEDEGVASSSLSVPLCASIYVCYYKWEFVRLRLREKVISCPYRNVFSVWER